MGTKTTLVVITLVLLLAGIIVVQSFKTQDTVQQLAYMGGFMMGAHVGYEQGEKAGYERGYNAYQRRFWNKAISFEPL